MTKIQKRVVPIHQGRAGHLMPMSEEDIQKRVLKSSSKYLTASKENTQANHNKPLSRNNTEMKEISMPLTDQKYSTQQDIDHTTNDLVNEDNAAALNESEEKVVDWGNFERPNFIKINHENEQYKDDTGVFEADRQAFNPDVY